MAQARIATSKTWAAFLVAAVAVVCFMNYQQANSTPVSGERHSNCDKKQQAEPIVAAAGDDDSDGLLMVPYSAECGPDEKNHPGAHPSCEPTCSNPNPMCIKIYYTSLDYVPCFCKAPLVRDTRTKKCVQQSECPSKSQRI